MPSIQQSAFFATQPRLWSRAEVIGSPCPVPNSPGVYGWYFRRLPESVPLAVLRPLGFPYDPAPANRTPSRIEGRVRCCLASAARPCSSSALHAVTNTPRLAGGLLVRCVELLHHRPGDTASGGNLDILTLRPNPNGFRVDIQLGSPHGAATCGSASV